MSAKLVAIRMAMAAAGVSVGLSAGQSVAAPFSGDLANTCPTVDAVEDAARHVRSSGCVTPQCEATLTIADVLRIDLDAAAATVGRPRPVPAGRDALTRKAFDRTILDHPERFDAVCEDASRLLSRYSLPGTRSEVFVAVNVLELGVEMDRRSGGKCLGGLIAALPHTAMAEKAIDNARRLCGARDRPASPSCQDITRSGAATR